MIKGGIPARLVVALMLFTAGLVNYMLRVNLSLNIIAMTPAAEDAGSAQSGCIADAINTSHRNTSSLRQLISRKSDSTTFEWSAQQQAYLLSAYFWSYAAACVVGGTIAERFGPRRVVFLTTLATAILTALSPWAARVHWGVLGGVRLLCGVFGGFLFPSLHALIARWAPPAEKGKFVSATQGGLFGTVLTWSISGPLLENWGWENTFYVEGAVAIVCCVIWWFLVYDSPAQHPRISDTERTYIESALGDKVGKKEKVLPPYIKILTSLPFLSLVILQFGNNWGVNLFTTSTPLYISTVLGFELGSTGALASMPYFFKMVFAFMFGVIGDRLLKRNVASPSFIRKFFCLFSHILPGLLLVTVGYTGCSPILSIVIMTCSLASNGSSSLTNSMNHQDLAPNFAGTVYGMANGVGNLSGFITPLVTAYFTKDGNGFAEWQRVFVTGASLYIASAIFFIFFGTAETQQWNYTTVAVKNNKELREEPSLKTNEDTKVAL